MNKPPRSPGTLIVAALFVLYPVLIYFGYLHLSPRLLAVLVMIFATARFLIRKNGQTQKQLAQKTKNLLPFLAVGLGIGVLVWVTDDAAYMRQIPTLANLGFLGIFVSSLLFPPNIIERFARQEFEVLPDNAIRYCRIVAIVWCVVIAVNSGTCAWLAHFGPHKAWLAWTTVGSYIFLGGVFGVEYLVRMRMKVSFDAAIEAMQQET
ncbi:MAG: hypothetical protein O3C57_04255 [Verrucomicrobia bacterium]|nr:hypothetical protein [Verrucomicrobiota bacterium]